MCCEKTFTLFHCYCYHCYLCLNVYIIGMESKDTIIDNVLLQRSIPRGRETTKIW